MGIILRYRYILKQLQSQIFLLTLPIHAKAKKIQVVSQTITHFSRQSVIQSSNNAVKQKSIWKSAFHILTSSAAEAEVKIAVISALKLQYADNHHCNSIIIMMIIILLMLLMMSLMFMMTMKSTKNSVKNKCKKIDGKWGQSYAVICTYTYITYKFKDVSTYANNETRSKIMYKGWQKKKERNRWKKHH